MSPDQARVNALSPELLNTIFFHSPVGIGAVIEGQGLVAINPMMAQFFGYTTEEINELGGPAVLVEDPATLQGIQEALAASGEFAGRIAFKHKLGHTIWHDVKARSIGESEGVSAGSIAWHIDVTHERNLSERLSLREHEFAAIIDRVEEAVTIREGGGVVYANPACDTVFGRPRSVLTTQKRPVVEWTVAEDRHKIHALYDAIYDAGTVPTSHQYRISIPDGSVRWLWTRVFPLSDAGGNAVTFTTDITENLDAAEKLRQKTREAEQASRAKSAFLANLSHEIRTPVAGILGLLELMEHAPGDEQQRYRGMMRDAAGSLVRMLEDVLDLSRIESNQLSIIPSDTDVGGAVASVVAMLRPRAVEQGIELTYEPEISLPDLCLMDRVRLQQLASNLVTNAVKYTEEGSVRVTLAWTRDDSGPAPAIDHAGGDETTAGKLTLSVEDTGTGMSEGQLELAFEPFRRLNESYTQKTEGTGLGLPLVKRLVELMNGELVVSSTVGDGTRFTATLPAPALDLPPEKSSPASPQRRKEHVVLLAEDNRIVQLTAQMQLTRGGHTVYLASNGLEAVEILRRHRVDLVLMDMQMPVMSGLDATIEIRKDESPSDRVPIVALTAYSSREDQEAFFAAGVNEIVTKPCSEAKILDVVAEFARG